MSGRTSSLTAPHLALRPPPSPLSRCRSRSRRLQITRQSLAYPSREREQHPPHLGEFGIEHGERRTIDPAHVVHEVQMILRLFGRAERDVEISRKFRIGALAASFRDVGRYGRDGTLQLIACRRRTGRTCGVERSMRIDCQSVRSLPDD